jgi:hypothetical protein
MKFYGNSFSEFRVVTSELADKETDLHAWLKEQVNISAVY